MSQDVCPWNVRFARELPADSPFAPREMLVGKDAHGLARELLSMTQAEFLSAFKNSPMKRATLRGLRRDAAVVLENSTNHSSRAGGEGSGDGGWSPRRK